jgi:hypothetical protein
MGSVHPPDIKAPSPSAGVDLAAPNGHANRPESQYTGGIPTHEMQENRSMRDQNDPAGVPESNVRVVYLIGLPRSGTTLLAYLFAGLPDSLSLSEPYLARSIYGPWRLRRFMRRLGREANLAIRPPFDPGAETAFQDYLLRLAAANGMKHLLVKETFRSGQSWDNIQTLDRLVAGSDPVLTIMRHPSDVAVSSLRLARWWRGITGRLLQLVAPRLPLFKSDLALIEYCADNWNQFADWSPRHASHQLRYEDLVGDPVRSLREACAKAQVPFDPLMVDHTRPRGAFGGIGDPGVMNRPARPVGTGSVGRKHLLKPEFVELIASRCADRASRFAYDL